MKKSNLELFLFPIFFALVVIAALQNVSAQTMPYTAPEKGSSERKIIFERIRKYRKTTNKVYNPKSFKIQSGRIFLSASENINENF